MKQWITIASVLCYLSGVSDLRAETQCSAENPDGPSGINTIPGPPDANGQSFTACLTGHMESLTIMVRALTPGQAVLRLHQGTNLQNVAWSQAVTVFDSLNTFTLAVPFPVSEGNVYSWSLTRVSEFPLQLRHTGNGYPGGLMLRLTNSTVVGSPDADQIFAAVFTDAGVPVRRISWGSIKASGKR